MRKIKFEMLIILLLSAFILNACGKIEDSQQGAENNIGKMVKFYKSEEEQFYNVKTNDSRIIYCTMSGTAQNFYYVEDIDHLSNKPFYTIDNAEGSIIDYAIGKGESNYFIINKILEGKETIYLKEITLDGEEISIRCMEDLYSKSGDNCYEWKIKVTQENNILICTPFAYCYMDNSGNVISEDSWENERSYEVVYLNEEYLCGQQYINGEREIFAIDRNSGETYQIKNLPEQIVFDPVANAEECICLYTNSEVFCYDIAQEEAESLCKWSDYGIVGDQIIKVYIKNKELHCIIFENENLYDLSVPIERRDNEKIKIVLGCVYEDQTVRKAVAEFNRNNQDYMIEVIEYGTEDIYAGAEKLYLDILSGKGPDIVRMDCGYLEDSLLGKRGILEDLTPYLNNSNVIGKEQLLPSVYQSLQIYNKIYMLPTNFAIGGFVTKNQWIKENHLWTVDELSNMIKNTPYMENMYLSKESVLEVCLAVCLNSTNGEENSYINKEILRDYLELAGRFPEEVVYSPEESIRKEGKVLFERAWLDDVTSFLYEKSVWGEDAVFVGYPEGKGNGMTIIPKNCYGICTYSAYKEQAWDFIERFFTEEWQEKITPNWNFSVCSIQLDKQFQEAMTINTYIGENGEQCEVPVLTYYSEGEYVDVYAAREVDIAQLSEMINGIEMTHRNNIPLLNIMKEEADFYFYGQKEIEEVVDIIENRIHLALVE